MILRKCHHVKSIKRILTWIYYPRIGFSFFWDQFHVGRKYSSKEEKVLWHKQNFTAKCNLRTFCSCPKSLDNISTQWFCPARNAFSVIYFWDGLYQFLGCRNIKITCSISSMAWWEVIFHSNLMIQILYVKLRYTSYLISTSI